MLGTSGNLSILIDSKDVIARSVSDEAISNRNEIASPSARNDKVTFEFLITASGKDKGELTEDDFILVDENGISVDGTSQRPSDETLLHSAIYKNTNAKAVFHVHTTNSTLLTTLPSEGQDKSCSYISFSGLEMLKGLGFKTHDVKINIPVIENSQDMKYLASIAPSYINEDVPGLLLKGHGIYAWGQSPHEAKRHVEIFEFLFEYRIKELNLEAGV